MSAKKNALSWKEEMTRLERDLSTSAGVLRSAAELEELFHSTHDFLRKWKNQEEKERDGEGKEKEEGAEGERTPLSSEEGGEGSDAEREGNEGNDGDEGGDGDEGKRGKEGEEGEWEVEVLKHEHFLGVILGKVVKTCLKRRISDEGTQYQLNQILQCIIQLIVSFFREGYDYPPLSGLLLEIFDEGHTFYSSPSSVYMDPRGIDPDDSAPWAPYHRSRSQLLVENINYFGNCEGFNIFYKRVVEGGEEGEEGEGRGKGGARYLKCVWGVLGGANLVRRYLRGNKYYGEWIKGLYGPLEGLLLELPDGEFKQVSQKEIKGIITALESLLLHFLNCSGDEVADFIERLQFRVGVKGLKCSALNKRLDGLQQINSLIETAKHDHSNYYHHPRSHMRVCNSTKLTDAILSSNVVELLFDSRIHHQLVRRSSDIFLLLAKKEKLDPKHLDIIWEATIGKGRESIVEAVYDIIIDIRHYLDTPQIETLLKKMALLPTDSVDSHTLRLQKDLSEGALEREEREEGRRGEEEEEEGGGLGLLGVGVLWRWGGDEGGLSVALQGESIECMSEVLSRFPRQHRYWVEVCIKSISEGKSVYQCIYFLQNILDTHYGGGGYSRNNQRDVIEQVDEEFCLLVIFFEDLVRFKEEAMKAFKQLPESFVAQADWNVDTLASSRPFLANIMVRLGFLTFLIRNSSLQLSVSQVDQLWDSLVTNSLCVEERERCFNWFQDICGTSVLLDCMLDADVCRHLFLDKLCQMGISTLEVGGFSCWERYFSCVNSLEQRAREWLDPKNFIVLDLELLGMEFLWAACFGCDDEVVFGCVLGRLMSLHRQLGPQLMERRAEFRYEAIRTVMDRLVELKAQHEANPSEKTQQSIVRAVEILKRFVIEFRGGPPEKSNSVLPIVMRYQNYHEKSYLRVAMEMCEEDSMLVVRDRLAERIGKPSCCVQLLDGSYHPYREETLSAYTLKQFEVKKDAILNFDINHHYPYDDEITEPDDKSNPFLLPSYILANTQQFFDQLWSLLSYGGVISSKIWELISIIPTNSRLEELISTLSIETNWSEVLDSTSTYRLEYALRIIKSIIDQQENEEDRQKWIIEFEQYGGVGHMYDVFFKEDVKSLRQHLRSACLASLLEVLGFFLVISDDEEGLNVSLREEEEEEEGTGGGGGLRSSCLVGGYGAPKMDFSLITDQLLTIIDSSAQITLSGPDQDEGELVAQSTRLLFASIFSRPEFADKLLKFPNLKEFLWRVLLDSREPVIRCEMALGLKKLITTLDRPSVPTTLLPILFGFLELLPDDCPFSDSYFDLVKDLIRDREKEEDGDDEEEGEKEKGEKKIFDIREYVDLGEVVVKVGGLLREHPVVERGYEGGVDEKLVGLLGLLGVLCSVEGGKGVGELVGGEEMIYEVFYRCLFESADAPTSQMIPTTTPPPKCKTAKARFFGLAALQSFCDEINPSYVKAMELLEALCLNLRGSNPWGYSPSHDRRSRVGFAGVKNLGCICYMISMLQQLYMIPLFRRGVLSIDFDFIKKREEQKRREKEELEGEGEGEKGEVARIEESPAYQLQVMFAYLMETQKQYYNPTPFTSSFKDSGGNPIDVTVQMDVDEFFNSLCDKLESVLKGTSQEYLMKNLFTGKEAMQLIGQTCNHRKENECAFNVITLTIKGKSNILEALSSYVEGDLLDGDNAYFCEGCDKKVDTLKRTCIKTLPNTLILHLKRFDFDFDTMRNEKVNDYCEFPMELDMQPYTREGVAQIERQKKKAKEGEEEKGGEKGKEEVGGGEGEDPPVLGKEEYDYELRGVLVHRGVADSGHYYSFIREREGGDGGWLEFNDETVKPFDVNNLAHECFGGEETTSQYNENLQEYVQKRSAITRNAYMLIYERKKAKEVSVLELNKGNDKEKEDNEKEKEKEKTEFTEEDMEWTKEDRVPERLHEEVWKNNVRHQQDIWVFDKSFLDSVLGLLRSGYVNVIHKALHLKDEETDQAFVHLRSFGKAYLEIVSHSDEREFILDYAYHYKQAIQHHIPVCGWLLGGLLEVKEGETKSLMLQMLFHCQVEETRESVAALLAMLFKVLFPIEREEFFENGKHDIFEDDTTFKYDRKTEDEAPLTLKMIRDLLSTFKYLPFHWRYFSEYFLLLREICLSDPVIRSYFLRVEIIPKLFDLFLGEESPTAGRVRKMGDKFSHPNFTHLLSLLSMLICTYHPIFDEIEELSCFQLESSIPVLLPEKYSSLILSKSFLKKVTKYSMNLEDVNRMFCHLCFNNQEDTEVFLGLVLDGIHHAEYDGIRPYFSILLPLLDLPDLLQENRVSIAMNQLWETISFWKKYPKFTKTTIDFTRSLRVNQLVVMWMEENKESWEWGEAWARERASVASSFVRPPKRLLWERWTGFKGKPRNPSSQNLWSL